MMLDPLLHAARHGTERDLVTACCQKETECDPTK